MSIGEPPVNEVGRCSHCGRFLIAEQYGSHTCTPLLKGVKEILIDYYYVTEPQEGKTVVMAKGMDGILYRLVRLKDERPRRLLGLRLSDDSLQGGNPTETGQYLIALVGAVCQ